MQTNSKPPAMPAKANDSRTASDKAVVCKELLESLAERFERNARFCEQHFAEDVADAERFRWLIKQGLAWRDCYDKEWLEGEWLYEMQDARNVVDAKRVARRSNENLSEESD
jgi:hypothetical protein